MSARGSAGGRAPGRTQVVQLPYDETFVKNEIPLPIGGGLAWSGADMLRRGVCAGEGGVGVWPERLNEIDETRDIRVLH